MHCKASSDFQQHLEKSLNDTLKSEKSRKHNIRKQLGKNVKYLLQLLKNLSRTDIAKLGSQVLRRPGSSQGSVD